MMPGEYFRLHEQYFWRWESDEDDQVIAIPEGMTIAYKKSLLDVLNKLAVQGLPPFGSLLLAIIATNPDGAASLDVVYRIVTSAIRTTDSLMVSKAIEFLKLLSEVPEIYKRGDKRVMLLQTLFEGCHNITSTADSNLIYLHSKGFGGGNYVAGISEQFTERIVDRDFRPISILANKYASVNDILKKVAGVPDVQQYEIDFDKVPAPTESTDVDFVDELINNTKTFAVGSLIRWLWGGINIPVHSTLPSQQPFGGISDLTNKGDYDRLLVSEFANEDIIFMSRLANNEALYIHREVPPADNQLQRIILIDASLKMWGTPKAIAFAIMLAIVRHPRTGIECAVFVLGADNYYTVSTKDVHTIIDALQIVEGSLSAAGSLEKFLLEHDRDPNKEILLITEPSNLAQPALLKVLNEHPNSIQYLFLADRTGAVDIYKRQLNSKKHLQHIKLDLATLWNRRSMKAHAREVLLPASVHYPILVSYPNKHQILSMGPRDTVFTFTNDGTVLRLFKNDNGKMAKGWVVIFEHFPFRPAIAKVGLSELGDWILLSFNTETKKVTIVNLLTAEVSEFPFPHWNAAFPKFYFEDQFFCYTSSTTASRIGLDGQVTPVALGQIDSIRQRDEEALLKVSPRHYNTANILKNVTTVFINKDEELVLNKHVLSINSAGSHLKLNPSKSRVDAIFATPVADDIFVFADGSTVEIDRAGLAILKSSDPSRPPIYFPLTVGESIAAATPYLFSGNDYYYPETEAVNRMQVKQFYDVHIKGFVQTIIRHHGA